MASGNFNLTRTGATSSYVSFKCYWSSTPDVSGNYSTVTVNVVASKGSGSTSNTWGTHNTSATVNGETQNAGGSFTLSPGGSVTLLSKSYIVPHNNDGSKTITISANVGGDVMWGNGSATVQLDTIPRHASITAAPNFNDEENPTINYSNPAGDAITSIQACIANSDGTVVYAAYRDIPKNGSSYTFELTDKEREALIKASLTSNTIPVKFYVTSVIGGVTDRSTLDKTLTIINATPELTISAKDVGAASKLLTGDENKIIKGFNYVLSSMSSKLKKGATIKSQTITNGSQTLIGEAGGTASMEGGFNNVESNTFIFGLTDSRGNTVNRYITLEMIDYINLTCNLDTKNPTADGDMVLKISGNYFNGNFGATNNTLAVAFRYKENDGAYSDWIVAEPIPTISGNTYETTVNLTGLNYRSRYTFQARAIDKINTGGILSNEKKVKTIPVYDWGENDFNFNVTVTFEGKSLIDLIYPVGSIYMSVTYFDPATIFGGTWERIMDKFLLGSGAIYASGQEGGEATHILTENEMPKHRHPINYDDSSRTFYTSWGESGSHTGLIQTNGANQWQQPYADWVGGNQPHNNMPPYLTVNIWKRTA